MKQPARTLAGILTEHELERFMAKVEITPTCWLWTAATAYGYGKFYSASAEAVVRAHRVSFAHFVGPIPDGACVLHSCDTPACVNPAHLRIGDRADNMQDCLARGRHYRFRQTHCKRGHPFDDENTSRNKHGHRQCRTCARAYEAQRVRIRRRVAK